MTEMADIHSSVKNYYGQTLQSSSDLKTNACCTTEAYPTHIKKLIANLNPEIIEKYYGCGLTIPTKLSGASVLDLGSGAGRDVFITSQIVGQSGRVVGVDMTPEQLDVARKHVGEQMSRFGFENSNVDFKEGYLEELLTLDIDKESFDVIISNCVINLVKDKRAVLSSCFELLKEGGEMYFSDVYASRRIPEHLKKDEVLYGECLSGALYWNDFENIAKSVGFTDPRVVESSPVTIENEKIQKKVGDIEFFSVTYRLFKIAELEPDCEDYGQAVVYKGNIENSEDAFQLDAHHYFAKGKVEPVCGNTWNMLAKTRFADSFDYVGNFENHFGIFEGCGKEPPFSETKSNTEVSCC